MAGKLQAMMSDLAHRIRLAGMVGKQFGGDRDLYEVLGYKRVLKPLDFYEMYYRNPIAFRAVNAFPAATWRAQPDIVEDEERQETQFEKAVQALVDEHKLWHYCERADKLAGIGRYSILILGVNDGAQMKEPLESADQLNWLMPVTEQWAEVATWEDDPTSPQFGRPREYRVTIGSEEQSTQPRRTVIVHYSRVIHIAENLGQDDVYGVPRLEPVFNRLYDLEKVVGGSAEMFWLGARHGLVFEADENATLGPDDVDKLEDDADEYQHQIKRLLTSTGGKWRVLESQTPDPKSNYETQIAMIAGGIGMPQRILTGSEQGQLASTQDETNWLSRINERRTNHVEPSIVRATIDRLIDLGVIPAPANGTYLVQWPSITGLSEKEQAEIGEIRARALQAYTSALGADMVVPPSEFRVEFMGLEEEPPGGFMAEDDIDEEPEPLPGETDV